MSRQGLLVSRSICLLCAAALMTAATLAVARATPADDAQVCVEASGDVAIEACARAITADGYYQGRELAILHFNLGFEYRRKGDSDRAIAAYSEAIRIDPTSADAFNNRGEAWRNKGNADRAIADYSEAIRLNPGDPCPFYNRGLAWSSKGDIDRAIADYSEAIRLDPKDGDYYESRAKAWSAKGDRQRTKADVNEALRLRALRQAKGG